MSEVNQKANELKQTKDIQSMVLAESKNSHNLSSQKSLAREPGEKSYRIQSSGGGT
jgi:hypothetical protein